MSVVYSFRDATRRIIYVGVSSNATERIAYHAKTKPWFPEVTSIDVSHFTSRADALRAEADLIKTLRPKYNRNQPSGKSILSPPPSQAVQPRRPTANLRAGDVPYVPDGKLAYRVPEVAAALGVSRAHIYNLITRGELRAVKIGGSTRIPASEVGRLSGNASGAA